MALFLVRAGKDGEHEQRFFSANGIYLPWDEVKADLSFARTYEDIRRFMLAMYPYEPPQGNWAGQVFAFAVAMKPGDWVVTPRSGADTMAIGRVAGPYEYCPGAAAYRHFRSVHWVLHDAPRSLLQQDLDSISVSMTVCPVSRDDAEDRVRSAAESSCAERPAPEQCVEAPPAGRVDRLAAEQIAKAVKGRFSGGRLADLTVALLYAAGFETLRIGKESEGVVEMVAVPRALGRRNSRVAVLVGTRDQPLDSGVLNSLVAAMQNNRCREGLLVSWGGADAAVETNLCEFLFRVRVWGQQELVDDFLAHYRKLDDAVRSSIPLKRGWMLK